MKAMEALQWNDDLMNKSLREVEAHTLEMAEAAEGDRADIAH